MYKKIVDFGYFWMKYLNDELEKATCIRLLFKFFYKFIPTCNKYYNNLYKISFANL